MQSIIQFRVSNEDTAFTAEGVNVPIVTEANSFERLVENIREAIDLFFENEDPATFGFTAHPAILANYEVPLLPYGHKA